MTLRLAAGIIALMALAAFQPAQARDDVPARALGDIPARALGASIVTAKLVKLPRTDAAGVPLPRPLNEADLTHYGEIFRLQESGKWRAADRRIKRLGSPVLMGHVLAQRYLHPTHYRSKFSELRTWMRAYADHPDARRIYRLAMRRKPASARSPRAPSAAYIDAANLDGGAVPAAKPLPRRRLSKDQNRRANALRAAARRYVRRGMPTSAARLLKRKTAKQLLSAAQIDELRARIASSYFFYGKDAEAFAHAAAAAKRSGTYIPIAHWTAGIAAWRLGRLAEASWHFEALAVSAGVSDWNLAAAAFWAARTRLVDAHPQAVTYWLKRAARHEYTFYGLLARYSLGMKNGFDWRGPRLSGDGIAAVLERAGGKRAIALLQAGQMRRAERELRQLDPAASVDLGAALLAVAERAQLPGLALRAGARLAEATGQRVEAALYPLPPWTPKDGYRLDRALIFAFIRQESGFNTHAKSHAGARGLMQLMPRTASFMAENTRFRGRKRRQLFDPELNLSLGQKYLDHLLSGTAIGGSLLMATAAYNGGPGKLAGWKRRNRYRDDPLLFIESIPSLETRIFIERVFANLWMYRERLGQSAPSLHALASGRWPTYTHQDGKEAEADHGRN